MSTYKILESQTGLDVINNIYASLDYISDVYLLNEEFDLNEMQLQSNVEYVSLTNASLNEIRNNGYIFRNSDYKSYEDIFTVYYKTCYLTNIPEIQLSNSSPNIKIKNITNGQSVIVSNGTILNKGLSLKEVYNQINYSIDTTYDELIYKKIDLNNENIITFSFPNVIKVTNDFVLDISNQLLTSFTFIESISWSNEGTSTINIIVSNSLQSTESMQKLLISLLVTNLSDVKLTLSSKDKVPSGTNWTQLQARGFVYEIV